MTDVVLFGTGSFILVDVEESLWRLEHTIAVGIRNQPGPCHLSDQSRSVPVSALPAGVTGLPYLVPLFTPGHRQSAAREATARGFLNPLTLTDPTSVLPERIALGLGSYVNAGCIIGAASRFGRFAFINRGAKIGHHCHAGDFVSIGPGAVVSGAASINDGAFIGAGAVILPKVTIGANAVVAAGAVVTRDVPDHCMVAGNPARVVREAIAGYNDVTVEGGA